MTMHDSIISIKHLEINGTEDVQDLSTETTKYWKVKKKKIKDQN